MAKRKKKAQKRKSNTARQQNKAPKRRSNIAMLQKPAERRISDTIRDLGEEGSRNAQETSSRAVEAFRGYQLKLLSAIHDNMNATMEYAKDVLQANSVSDLLEVSTSHSRRQFEMMAEQARELSSSALGIVSQGAQPMAAFGNFVKEQVDRE